MAKGCAIFWFGLTVLITTCWGYPKNIFEMCPQAYRRAFQGYIPMGNITAGFYEKIPEVNTLKGCFIKCCRKEKCNVAFFSENICYHITCSSNELCVPTMNPNLDKINDVEMVLVRTTDDDTWEDVLASKDKAEIDREVFSAFNNRFQDVYKDFVMEESYPYEVQACEVGTDNCMVNEVCVRNREKSRAGTCHCKDGYERNRDTGDCIQIDIKDAALRPLLNERIIEISDTANSPDEPKNMSKPMTRQHLNIVAESKEVRLPKNEVALLAQMSDETETNGDNYQFTWTSLKEPELSTAVKHQNGGQLHLEKLVEGVYQFKVGVESTNAYGETFVNVTVLPASRINKPPVIVITPANQTIKQPNTVAVLDASSTTDDDGILSWHWELQQGPVGYQPQLKDVATLQLNDLTKAGNYTFKLTVTDTDKATSSSTANITVLKFTDYPPEANAGADRIIYLPQNSITLNGNMSTDDHNITTWEWTKSADDAQKAVDMQDTRTPYLKLSHLEEGVYMFTLKVTDSANQSSTAQVHVFVKPPTNKPPVANAGHNLTISLPQTWIVLDASNSSDDSKIVNFKWEQVIGPSTVAFENSNVSVTNVTGLTKGVYLFKVSVTDDNNNVASDNVYVIVNQNQNQKPTANAGEDFSVELPINAVILNGSKSRDDWAVTKWKWIRDDKSLAIGNIVEKSDETSVLIITDVSVGKYVFNLTVYDEQGLFDTDTVTFTVKEDSKLFHLVELTLDVDVATLTEEQYVMLQGKIALLINDGTKLQVRNLKREYGTSKALITFYAETSDNKPVSANDVVQHLRQKLKLDENLLGYEVSKLQTAVCQNNCSGHGVCNEKTRMCECEAFWMQDMFKVYLKTNEDSDCSWSVLYVVLGLVTGFILFVGSMWALVYICYSWCTKQSGNGKPTNYKLIEDTDDLPPFATRKHNLSDSDTDSDVVFESRSKPRNNHKNSRNGFSKMNSRRGLKT